MAFCSNCGHELIDGVKFCSVCGAPTDKSNSLGMNTSANNEVQMRYQQPPQVSKQNAPVRATYDNPLKKKSGRTYAVILFVVACFLILARAGIVSAMISIGIIVGAVMCFKKGYKFKLLTALAFLIAALALVVSINEIVNKSKSDKNDLYAYETDKTDEVSSSAKKSTQTSTANKTESKKETAQTAQTQTKTTEDISNTENTEKAVTEEKAQETEEQPAEETKTEPAEETKEEAKQEETSNTGVDPDLKAFLDSYEAFVDEYVVFMKKYQSDPGNAVAMLNDYTKIMNKYADFTDKINKYDTKTMSKADLEYYLDVTNRCSKKMLSIY